MTSYRKEFPDFGLMDVALPLGFIDNSWHNDAMPCFTKDLGRGRLLNLWVDYENPDLREFQNQPRFWLQVATDEVITGMHQSNDFDEILSLIVLMSSL